MTGMPPLGTAFVKNSTATMDLIAATETLWLTARKGTSVRRLLKPAQLEALYEAAYLRIFTQWEGFLEESLIRYMAGRTVHSYVPTPVAGKRIFATVASARSDLYGSRNYLLWHNATQAIARCRRYLQGCPFESALDASVTQLDDYSAIRHRIAHATTDAHAKFLSSATRLTGQSHGQSPGKLLRDADISDPLNQRKWLLVITSDLQQIALQVAP